MVTTLLEDEKAQLVVMTHDVDPIKLLGSPPTLCHKMGFLTVSSRGNPPWVPHSHLEDKGGGAYQDPLQRQI